MFQSLYGENLHEIEFLKKIYEKKWEKLVNFNLEFIKNCCEYLEIKTPLYRASELNVSGKRTELLLNICKKFDATKYLSTIGSKDYLDEEQHYFNKDNIQINYHEYKHPIYKQKGSVFLEKLSILDLLFNEKENSKKFI